MTLAVMRGGVYPQCGGNQYSAWGHVFTQWTTEKQVTVVLPYLPYCHLSHSQGEWVPSNGGGNTSTAVVYIARRARRGGMLT